MNQLLTIVTRKSPLALWQAEYVQKQLLSHYPELKINILGKTTQGDQTQKPLTDIGGKDLFVKDLQKTLLNEQTHIAVHSIKDMSAKEFPGLTLAAFCKREDPRDAFVSNQYKSLHELPAGAIVGTSSPRRHCQLKMLQPDIIAKPIRGNVGTRLTKLDTGEYDAIILAVAGLKRLNLENKIREHLNPDHFIPAIGQGIIGIECRSDDAATQALLKTLDNREARLCATAERAVNRRLEGDCFTPLAAHAILIDDEIQLCGMVGNFEGHFLRSEIKGPAKDAEKLGTELADDLLSQGAAKLLKSNP